MKTLAMLCVVALTGITAAPVAALTNVHTTTPLATPVGGDPVQSAVGSASSAFASFGDRTLDLRAGWGTARACRTDGRTTQCFRTEAELDASLASASSIAGFAGAPNALTSCTSSLKLYSGVSYTGSVLALTTRFTFLTLSTYGFDNLTSSFKVGGCAATLYDGAAGAGSIYPGSTAAGVQSAIMVTGWADRVSSAYIA